MRMRMDSPLMREVSPETQEKMQQALGRVTYLFAKILHDQESLEGAGMSLEQSLDFLAERILDVTYLFGIMAGDFEDSNLDFPIPSSGEQQAEKDIDPRHFYAAYVFDRAHERQSDITTLVAQAQQFGYPVRYWWLSETIELRGSPNRLIVCVHHPSSAEDAGMDLYKILVERQVTWDDLEAAAVGEYRTLGKPIEGPEVIYNPDRTPLFPPATE